MFIGIVGGDCLEQNCAGGNARSIEGRQEVGLSKVDEVDGLPRDHEKHEAEEDPRDKGMGVVAILVLDVGKGEDVKLLLTTTASGIDRKQNGPGDEATDKADDDGQLKVTEQEIAIERVVLEDVFVGNLSSGWLEWMMGIPGFLGGCTFLMKGIQPNRVLGAEGVLSWGSKAPR